MDHKSLETRYAAIHPLIHHTFGEASIIAANKEKLLQNPESLLFYKNVLLRPTTTEFKNHLHEMLHVVEHQNTIIVPQKLDFKKSYKKYLQSSHTPFAYLQQHGEDHPLSQGKAAILEAITLAKQHFPPGTFAVLLHDLSQTTSLENPIFFGTFAAAHDGYYFEQLQESLAKQKEVLSTAVKTKNIDVQRQVLGFLRSSFEDELHALAILDHQQLHNWATCNEALRR